MEHDGVQRLKSDQKKCKCVFIYHDSSRQSTIPVLVVRMLADIIKHRLLCQTVTCLMFCCPVPPHPPFQMPVNSHWIQTQQTITSLCPRTTERWQWCRRSCRTLTIQSDFTIGSRCCAQKGWSGAVTGKWTGKDGLILEWHTSESKGKGRMTTAGSDRTTSPGVCYAVISSLPVTKTGG